MVPTTPVQQALTVLCGQLLIYRITAAVLDDIGHPDGAIAYRAVIHDLEDVVGILKGEL